MNDKAMVQLTQLEVAVIFTALDYVSIEFDRGEVNVSEQVRHKIYGEMDALGIISALSINNDLAKRLADTFEGVSSGCENESQLERELVTLLSDYVGETGRSESAVEVLSRLLTELERYRDEKRAKKEAA